MSKLLADSNKVKQVTFLSAVDTFFIQKSTAITSRLPENSTAMSYCLYRRPLYVHSPVVVTIIDQEGLLLGPLPNLPTFSRSSAPHSASQPPICIGGDGKS